MSSSAPEPTQQAQQAQHPVTQQQVQQAQQAQQVQQTQAQQQQHIQAEQQQPGGVDSLEQEWACEAEQPAQAQPAQAQPAQAQPAQAQPAQAHAARSAVRTQEVEWLTKEAIQAMYGDPSSVVKAFEDAAERPIRFCPITGAKQYFVKF